MSTPSSSRWVAKLWRSVCGPTRLVISAALGCLDDNAVHVPGGDRLRRYVAPGTASHVVHHAASPPYLPPLAQQGEEIGRKHGVAVPATLALLDADQHAFAVDIARP